MIEARAPFPPVLHAPDGPAELRPVLPDFRLVDIPLVPLLHRPVQARAHLLQRNHPQAPIQDPRVPPGFQPK